ncbi:MAG: TonB-dependent receptor [Planctomycetia bacterium]|nr:TonB-dependent receptor [Planctomycetia bacterium]
MTLIAPVSALAQSEPAGSSDGPATQAGSSGKPAGGILDMDIEQLAKTPVVVPSMDIPVTLVAKEESTVGRSAAAVFVITNEMIRRSGANNIPDLLRLVPGLEVARVDAHDWAISSRGFNGVYSNKLLVLIDGRTVYSPLFSGVYWDIQDLLLEDIERIEVIRGPGGTLWGANAVNGVINIISKKAKDTQGALVTYGGGSEDHALGGFRVGGAIGKDLHYRVYGKHREEAAGFNPGGPDYDAWRQGRAGFRADWEPDRDKSNLVTVQGDYYIGGDGTIGEDVTPFPPYSRTTVDEDVPTGGNVLARWTHVYDADSDWMLQTYFDRARRADISWSEALNTFDVEFQHRFPLAERHKVIWGTDYRQVHDDVGCDGFGWNLTPPQRTTGRFDVFVQDEIVLVEDRLSFTVGSKFEHNDYTGFEYQPSGRVLYTPDKKHSLWGAVSRAVRTPSEFERDGFITDPPEPMEKSPYQYFPRWEGPLLHSEDLMAYEIGYRAQPEKRFAYDLALFYNVYENLLAFREEDWFPEQHGEYEDWIAPIQGVNGMRGESYGVEVAGQWTMSDAWRLSGSYSFLRMHLHAYEGILPDSECQEGYSPHNQVRFLSSWDLGHRWQFDLTARYVDSLSGLGTPEYTTMDARLAWQPNKRFEFAVIGRNLLDDHHPEFGPSSYFYHTTEVKRSVFGKVTWRY